MRSTLQLVAVAATFLLPGGAAGQSLSDFERVDADRNGAVSQSEFMSARRRDFEALDANKDGLLSREEFVGLRGADRALRRLRERRFAEIDADASKTVSLNEYLEQGRRQFAALDRNRDGQVTRAEFEAALARAMVLPSGPAGGAANPPPLERPRAGATGPGADDPGQRAAFASMDRDRDGFVTEAELDAARLDAFRQMDADRDGRLTRQEIVAARGVGAAVRFDAIDADGNGVISPSEFLAAGRVLHRAADVDRDGKLSLEEFSRPSRR